MENHGAPHVDLQRWVDDPGANAPEAANPAKPGLEVAYGDQQPEAVHLGTQTDKEVSRNTLSKASRLVNPKPKKSLRFWLLMLLLLVCVVALAIGLSVGLKFGKPSG